MAENQDNAHQQGRYGIAMLFGLGRPNLHVYGGTVPEDVKQRRRAANRQARKSRRINRRRGAR